MKLTVPIKKKYDDRYKVVSVRLPIELFIKFKGALTKNDHKLTHFFNEVTTWYVSKEKTLSK